MSEDKYNLERFVRRQEEDYDRAYLEHPVLGKNIREISELLTTSGFFFTPRS
jgi:uncharacterized protein (DUF1810 family)